MGGPRYKLGQQAFSSPVLRMETLPETVRFAQEGVRMATELLLRPSFWGLASRSRGASARLLWGVKLLPSECTFSVL